MVWLNPYELSSTIQRENIYRHRIIEWNTPGANQITSFLQNWYFYEGEYESFNKSSFEKLFNDMVMRFQEDKNLLVDAKVGEQTQNAMISIMLMRPPYNGRKPSNYMTLEYFYNYGE